MPMTQDWIDLLERREREAEARDALAVHSPARAHLGRAISRARHAAGMTIEDLSRVCGLSPEDLRALESEASEGHCLDHLQAIADGLELQLTVGFQQRS